MNRQAYLQQLRQRLKFRGAPRQRVNDIVAEVDSHLIESGEDPVEAFGTPERYAARLLRGRWHTARNLIAMIAAVSAAPIGVEVVRALAAGEATLNVTVQQQLYAAVLVLAIAPVHLPAVNNRLPSVGARLLVVLALLIPASYLYAVVSTTSFGQQALLTLSIAGGIAVFLGSVAVAGVLLAGPWLARRRRRG